MKHTHFSHPGEILKTEYLEGFGLSVKAAAEAMRIPRTRLNDIVLCRRGISADTALRLSKLFGGSAVFWTNLQAHYDLAEAEAKAKGDKSYSKIRSITVPKDGARA